MNTRKTKGDFPPLPKSFESLTKNERMEYCRLYEEWTARGTSKGQIATTLDLSKEELDQIINEFNS